MPIAGKQTISGERMAYKIATATPRLGRLPGGLPSAPVTEFQRSRMLAAAVDAVQDVGYARMTVAQVTARAGVSRKTFYGVFTDREDCFMAAFEHGLSEASLVAQDAFQRESGWREGVRSALASVLMFMDAEPGLTRLCIVEALGAGERALRRRAAVLDELAVLIDRGRLLTDPSHEPPQVTAEGVLGAIFGVLHRRVLGPGQEPLRSLLGPLMSMIVLPYLGVSAATRELSTPGPRVASDQHAPGPVAGPDPLDGLDMRLTYRTVRVLTFIAGQPGASNRQIAEGSAVVDPSQISKLLNRLARLTLVENLGGQQKGAPNAWQLTARGAQLERTTRISPSR